MTAYSIPDTEITRAIQEGESKWGQIWCPHTATAVRVHELLAAQNPEDDWILVSTAHPAKFESIIEPLIGRRLDIPSNLAMLLDRPEYFETMPASFPALKAKLAQP